MMRSIIDHSHVKTKLAPLIEALRNLNKFINPQGGGNAR